MFLPCLNDANSSLSPKDSDIEKSVYMVLASDGDCMKLTVNFLKWNCLLFLALILNFSIFNFLVFFTLMLPENCTNMVHGYLNCQFNNNFAFITKMQRQNSLKDATFSLFARFLISKIHFKHSIKYH